MVRDSVMTVVKAGGQYQVVIGNHAPDVYAAVLAVGGVQGAGTVEAHEEAVKKNPLDAFLGPLAAAGIIKGVVAILTADSKEQWCCTCLDSSR